MHTLTREVRNTQIKEALTSPDPLVRLRAATRQILYLRDSAANDSDGLRALVRSVYDDGATGRTALLAAERFLSIYYYCPGHRMARAPIVYLVAYASGLNGEYSEQFREDHGETLSQWADRYLDGGSR